MNKDVFGGDLPDGLALWMEDSIIHDGIMDALHRCAWSGKRLVIFDPETKLPVGCIVTVNELAVLQSLDRQQSG